MKKLTRTFLILFIFQMAVVGYCQSPSKGVLIGKVQDKSLSLMISEESIQVGLSSLFSPDGQNFDLKSVEIIEYQNRYFLKILGYENQKCMVALKESNGDLFELNDISIPIVVCTGCNDGCEPQFEEGSWHCSDGCPECIKTTAATDHYIFK